MYVWSLSFLLHFVLVLWFLFLWSHHFKLSWWYIFLMKYWFAVQKKHVLKNCILSTIFKFIQGNICVEDAELHLFISRILVFRPLSPYFSAIYAHIKWKNVEFIYVNGNITMRTGRCSGEARAMDERRREMEKQTNILWQMEAFSATFTSKGPVILISRTVTIGGQSKRPRPSW